MSEKFVVNWNYGANDCFYLSIKDSIHNKKLSEKFLHFMGKKEDKLTLQILRDYTSENLETIVNYLIDVLLNIHNNLDLFKEDLFFDIDKEIYSVKKDLMDKNIIITLLTGERKYGSYLKTEDMIYLFKNIINDKITNNETKRMNCVNHFKKNIKTSCNFVSFIDIFSILLIYKKFIKSVFNESGKIIIFDNYNRPPKEFKKDKNLYIYYKNKNNYYQAWVFKNFSKYTINIKKFKIIQNTGAGDCYYLSIIDSINNKKLSESFLKFMGNKYKDSKELTVQILRNFIAEHSDQILNSTFNTLLDIPDDKQIVIEDVYKSLGTCVKKSTSTSSDTSCSCSKSPNNDNLYFLKADVKNELGNNAITVKSQMVPSVYTSILKTVDLDDTENYLLTRKIMLFIFKNILNDKDTDNETKRTKFINYYKTYTRTQYNWATFIEICTFELLYKKFIKCEFDEIGEVINLDNEESPPIDFEKDKNLYFYYKKCHYRSYVFKNYSNKRKMTVKQKKSKKILKEYLQKYKKVFKNIKLIQLKTKKLKSLKK
jgi:hypothetical protein